MLKDVDLLNRGAYGIFLRLWLFPTSAVDDEAGLRLTEKISCQLGFPKSAIYRGIQ